MADKETPKPLYPDLEKLSQSKQRDQIGKMTHDQLVQLGQELDKKGEDANAVIKEEWDKRTSAVITEAAKSKDAEVQKTKDNLVALRRKMKLADVKVDDVKDDPFGNIGRPKVDVKELGKERVAIEVRRKIGAGLTMLNEEEREKAGILEDRQYELNAVGDVIHKLSDKKVSEIKAQNTKKNAEARGKAWGLTTDSEYKALHFLALVLEKRSPQVQKLLDRRGKNIKVDDMTLGDFMDEGRKVSEFVADFAKNFKEVIGGKSAKEITPDDLQEVIEKTNKIDVAKSIKSSDVLKKAAVALGVPENKVDEFSGFVGVAGASTVDKLGNDDLVKEYAKDNLNTEDRKDAIKFRDAIKKMHEYVKKEVVGYVALYTGDEVYMGDKREKFQDLMKEYLEGNELTIQDVVDLYIIVQICEQQGHDKPLPGKLESTTGQGFLMIQMKILQILYKRDAKYGTAYKGVLARLSTSEGMKRFPNIPPEALEALQKTGEIIDDAMLLGLSKLWKGAKKQVRDWSILLGHYLEWDPAYCEILIWYLLIRMTDETLKLTKMAAWLTKTGSGLAKRLEVLRGQRSATGKVANLQRPNTLMRRALRNLADFATRLLLGGGALDFKTMGREFKELKIRENWDLIEKRIGRPALSLYTGEFQAIEDVQDMAKQGKSIEDIKRHLQSVNFTEAEIAKMILDPDIVGPDVVKLAGGKPVRPPLDTGKQGDVRAQKADLSGEKLKPGDWLVEAKRLGIKVDGKTQPDIETEVKAHPNADVKFKGKK